jgi:hypothetical protein
MRTASERPPARRPAGAGLLTAALVLALLAAGAARAEPLAAGGLTFSDELGGLQVKSASGSGSLDDPFVVAEDILDEGPAILTVLGLTARFGNRVRTQHLVGLALVKVVTNRTRRDWDIFEMELREKLANSSTYEDGLSFAQDASIAPPLASDVYANAYKTDEPLDSIVFSGGVVRPGETVRMRVIITDYSPNTRFYLLQRRNAPVASAEPQPRRYRR